MNHLLVVTPMYGGMCTGSYTQSLLQLGQAFPDQKVSFSFMFNESLIQRARNALVHFAFKTDFTHLMFIDADIAFNPMDMVKMVEADKPIIAGIYPKKEINWALVRKAAEEGQENLSAFTGSFVVNLLNQQSQVTVPVNEPVEVENVGTGFMLIKRSTFEIIEQKMEIPTYRNDVGDLSNNVQAGEQIKEFFACPIDPDSKRLLSEDYYFCQLARKAGLGVYAAPWAQLAHIGTYVFSGNLLPAP